MVVGSEKRGSSVGLAVTLFWENERWESKSRRSSEPLVSTWALASGMVLGQRSREFGTPSWSASEVAGVEATVREMGEESVDAPPLSSAVAFRVCMPGVVGVKENVQGEEVLVEMRVFLS